VTTYALVVKKEPTEPATPSPSSTTTKRAPRTAFELFGLSREELDAMGQERFEKLLAEAFERQIQKKMATFDAALESARAMAAAGNADAGFGLLRSAAVVLAEESIHQRDISRRFARMIFGSRSERLDAEELKQLFLAFGGDEPAFDAATANGTTPPIPTPEPPSEPATPTSQTDAPAKPGKKKRPNHHGRAPLVASCPVVETTVAVPDHERPCALCGKDKGCITHVRHERIDFEPPKLTRHVELREVRSCSDCKKDVVTAPRSEPAASRRRVGNGIVADLIVEKCSEAQPLNRERERYRRLGWDAPPSTIDGAWRWGTELLSPIADVVRGALLASDYVRADSTPLLILDPKHPSGRFKGQVWTFCADGHVAFEFTKSWAAKEIAQSFLVCPDGYKQVDDYKGYASELTLEPDAKSVCLVRPDRRLGCGMHIRRRFVEALDAKELRAAVPLELFRQLYAVEADAKARALSHDDRHALRQQKSLPVLAKMRTWLDSHLDKHAPKSPLGGAVRYADQQWIFFERCFSRGDFEIDNGAPEREIRTIAIGRRNFLFSGSIDAAARLCAAYTLVVGAKRLGVDPFAYVKDLLDKLERGWKIDRVAELTPRRWAAAQAAK
jgi:transposase